MPISPGWTLRNTNTAQGTTSLSLTKPTGTVDNDIMIIAITHKGTGFATMPAGWTLIAQDIQNSTRHEVYWRRAASEGSSYSITGLADTATGLIISYQNGLLSGNVVAQVATTKGTGLTGSLSSVTTTNANAMVIVTVGTSTTSSVSHVGLGTTYFNNLYTDLEDFQSRTTKTTTNGTHCGVYANDTIINNPNTLPAGSFSISGSSDWVATIIEFIPETVASTTGTRYYLAQKPLPWFITDPLQGDWDSAWATPSDINGFGNLLNFEMSQLKVDAGAIGASTSGMRQGVNVSCNQTDYNVCWGRWFSPRLEAQTISGTFNTMLMAGKSWSHQAGSPYTEADIDVRWQVHIYISKGDTGQVRSTLLNSYVDSASRITSITHWMQLASAQTLTSQTCLAGDRVVVEIGYRFVTVPMPTPLYPPQDWAYISGASMGASSSASVQSSVKPQGVGLPDATAGDTNAATVGFFDFSNTLTEQAVSGSNPTNSNYLTPTVISSLPYDSDFVDNTLNTLPGKPLWYQWTAPSDMWVIVSTHGTNYSNDIFIPLGTWTPGTNAANDKIYTHNSPQPYETWSINSAILNATSGQTYLFRITRDSAGYNASGGVARLRLTEYSNVPQEDDVYLEGQNIYVYRDTDLINISPNFISSGTAAGIYIDYSKTPIKDFSDGVGSTFHTGDRLLVGVFPFALIEILDLGTLSLQTQEIDFIDSFDTQQNISTILTKTDGTILAGFFGNGFQHVNGSNNTATAAYLNHVSSTTGKSAFGLTTITNGNEANAIPTVPTDYVPTTEICAPWHIDIASDGQTVYYTSGGFYLNTSNVGGSIIDQEAQLIKRFDLTTGLQLSDFATVTLAPITTGVDVGGLHGLAVHPNGTVLVCNGGRVDLLDTDGTLIRSFTGTSTTWGKSTSYMIDVVWCANGVNFWAYDANLSTLFQFNSSTGSQLQAAETFTNAGNTTQIAIYRPNGISNPTANAATYSVIEPPMWQLYAFRVKARREQTS